MDSINSFNNRDLFVFSTYPRECVVTYSNLKFEGPIKPFFFHVFISRTKTKKRKNKKIFLIFILVGGFSGVEILETKC